MSETEKRKLESLESLPKDAIIAQDAHYKRQRVTNPARRAAGRGDGQVVHQQHGGWREEWMELWGLEVSEHREMNIVKSHNDVRWKLSGGEISLLDFSRLFTFHPSLR